MYLKKKNMLATSIFKISVGIIIMGLGFIFMIFASIEAEIYETSSMYWLFLAYLFFTIGELCASPVILSYITKLSPKELTASIMGIYFATIGLGNKLAGVIGQYSQVLGEKAIFIGITVICVFVGGSVIMMHKRLIKLSHGVDD
jgi:POT family proton-dependent oligopeptide transporter